MSNLTPYDTGKRAEPKVWEERHRKSDDDYGKVDFNDDGDYTIATLHIELQPDSKGYVLKGYTNEPLDIDIDDQSAEDEMPAFKPTATLQQKVKEVIARLDTPLERDEASVYWGEGQALILVPGEKGYRKQQAIIVDEPGEEYHPGLGWSSEWDYSGVTSAIVKSWSAGVQRTRD